MRRRAVDDEDRFESYFLPKVQIDPVSGCWLWTASLNPKGYGQFYDGSHMRLAHHWHWVLRHGPVPDGLVLDHIVCDNPRCVNLAHLRLTTSKVNTLRSAKAVAAIHARKTTCPRDHPYDAQDATGWRRCNRCRRERAAERRMASAG